jgi:hypothetical protein
VAGAYLAGGDRVMLAQRFRIVRSGKYIVVRHDLLVELDVAAGSSRRTVQVDDNRLFLTRRRPIDVRYITYI